MIYGYAQALKRDQNLDLQVSALLEAGVEEKNIWRETVSDDLKSEKRPILSALLRKLKKDDTLVVCKLDRLGHSAMEFLKSDSTSKGKKITLRSLTENRVFYAALAMVDELEKNLTLEYIRERIHAGMAVARKLGHIPGARRKLNESERQALIEGAETGMSITELAREFDITRQTVYRYIAEANVVLTPRLLKLPEQAQKEVVRKYLEEDATVAELAQEYNVRNDTIYRIIDRAGVRKPNQPRIRKHKLSAQEKAQLAQDYSAGGTVDQLCEKYSISVSTLYRYLSENDHEDEAKHSYVKVTSEMKAKMAEEYQSGDILEVIAARHGITASTVCYHLRKMGVLRRARGPQAGGELTPKQKEFYQRRALESALAVVANQKAKESENLLSKLTGDEQEKLVQAYKSGDFFKREDEFSNGLCEKYNVDRSHLYNCLRDLGVARIKRGPCVDPEEVYRIALENINR